MIKLEKLKTPQSKYLGERSDVHRAAFGRKIMVKVSPGSYRGQHNYWRGTVFTRRNNFINASPGFIRLKLGFHW